MKMSDIGERASTLFAQQQLKTFARTDRLFAKLFILEYFAGIGAALWVSPLTWVGDRSSPHLHVYAAVFLGALIFSFPLLLIWKSPGRVLTRHVIGISQMLYSALLIHLSGGRIETHFHVFGSLAFLSFYRDWRVLMSASFVVALDHFFRGVYWPVSVYGSLSVSSWRWLEHTGWVLFEDLFLILASTQSLKEMRATAERQAESEAKQAMLRKSEFDFRTIFESSATGKFEVCAETGRFLRVNRKFCQMTGYNDDELLTLGLQDIVPAKEGAARADLFRRVACDQRDSRISERLYLRKDGSLFWGLATAALIHDADGRQTRFVSTILDVSAWKIIEEDLAEAKARAEEANETKSAFLANMSHEIRTPLGAMLGFAQLMIDDQNAGRTDRLESLQNLHTILRNGEQLFRIIDDILDISKVEANKIEIAKVKFNLADMVNDVVSLLSIKASEKGLNLDIKSLGPLPESIFSDPSRIRQILMNVIGNAIKFTDNGRVEVFFRLKSAAEFGNEMQALEVRVVDTGPGIPNEKQRKLFQPFSQLDSASTRKFGGTGLGLYLSKRLAIALGGDLVLEKSEIGRGCAFCMTIEAGTIEAREFRAYSARREEMIPRQAPSEPVERIDGIAVLVVDDSADNLQITRRFLGAGGASVICVDGAKKALRVLEEKEVDVVVMDIQMPEIDGYEAVRILRRTGYVKPVIALTAHAMKGERERCLNAGFDEYLVKPIHRPSLLKLVKEQANRLKRQRSLSPVEFA